MQEDYLTAKAARGHLNAARMATLLRQAKSVQARAFRDEVLELLYKVQASAAKTERRRVRAPQCKEQTNHRLTLDALLADLVFASGHVDALGYCYSTSNRQWFTDTATQATSKTYDWQVAALESAGLIHRWIGYAANDDFDGDKVVNFRTATRMRATPRLMEIAQRYDVMPDSVNDHYNKLMPKNVPTVVLRASKVTGGVGKTLRCPDTDQAASIGSEVKRINAIYERHRFDRLPRPQVYRVFNCADADGFAFNKGGRLIGDFQNIRSLQRKDALINGQPVVELDLKSSHLTILYGITQTPMSADDPYIIEGLPRPIVKAVVTAMIGLGHTALTRWSTETKTRIMAELGNIDSRMFSKLYPAKTMAERVLKQHPVLHHLSPGRLDWADLQFLESQVLVSVVLQLGEESDIPALPVHDSIIVPAEAEELGRRCLSATFERITGQTPTITSK